MCSNRAVQGKRRENENGSTLHNPLATDGFEFVEYTAPTAEGIADLRQLFLSLGFVEVARTAARMSACTVRVTSTSS
jgi:4-hydroxyphenylpyruvate dioxygenase-like putative hemolysin